MAEDKKPMQRVGDYEFLDRLAVGGMGQLWRVRHVTLGAIYVAKQLRDEYREDPEFLKRFLHEARLVANLRHPNVVQVFGYDQEHALYLMEYVQGMDLDRLMRSRRVLTFPEKRTIIEVVADTIGYAHREFDLIHRDIKPSNVLIAIANINDPIQRSRIKLTDFGIAKVLSSDQRMTMASGMVMGTVHYMAPEQFEGDARKPSDVYAIGVLYYQLLTGKLPFDGPTAFVIRDKHMNLVPPAPRELSPEVPVEDSDIVMKCLEKNAAKRFQDGAELYEEFVASRPTSMTISVARGHPKPPRAGAATGVTAPVEPTALLDATGKTIPKGPSAATERTIPAAAAAVAGVTERTIPAAVDRGTEVTIAARRERVRRRHPVRLALIAAAAAVVLAIVAAALVVRPTYDIQWSTLRSDPLDTPQGIQVSVSPKIASGALWWPVGTIGEQAPPPLSNWMTWFDSIDVKLSDGLYREFVVTLHKPEGSAHVDFGGATFEQFAKARDAKVAEDLSKVGDYINAVLVPANVASGQCLADAQRYLSRVADLETRATGIDFDKTRLTIYRGAVSNLVEAAVAIADGDPDLAADRVQKAEGFIGQIDRGDLAKLPDDFLFRQTVREAAAGLKERAAAADRLVKDLQPAADLARSIQVAVEKFGSADAAVARYLFFSPGRSALLQVMKTPEGDGLEARIAALGDQVPPSIATTRAYLARLDELLHQAPSKEAEALLRTSVLKLMDDRLAAAQQVERPAWLEKCFAREDLGFVDLVPALWQEAHQRRFNEAAQLCWALAKDRVAKAAGQESPTEAKAMFADAELALAALQKAVHVPEDTKKAAEGSLATASLKHALVLFRMGPGAPDREEERLATIRALLDRGLEKLPGAAPEAREEARVVRDMLEFMGDARAKLSACLRENFAIPGTYGGRIRSIFDALDACERLLKGAAQYAEHPAAKAALDPFLHLRTEAFKGYALPNAAACWLLGSALQSCGKARYGEAAVYLQGFLRSPEQAESPLKRLLAEPITSKAEKLCQIAGRFDETQVPIEGIPARERWKRLWDERLAAKPLLALDIPQSVPAGSVPKAYEGQEDQWAAIYGQMRAILAHFSGKIQAEEDLRALEAQVDKLVIREGDAVRPNPAAATPAAIGASLQMLQQLKDSSRIGGVEDQPSRLAAVERDLASLRTDATQVRQRIAATLAKPDPRAALDEIKTWKATLGKDPELELTRQAVADWVKLAVKEADADRFDAAVAGFKAIEQHAQVQAHAADPQVKSVLAEAANAMAYCEGQRALAQGVAGFAAALPKLQQAGAYRDAESIRTQIAAYQEADKLRAANPFQAWDRLAALLKSDGLNPGVKAAADSAAKAVQAVLVRGAASCTKAFNDALAKGDWEQYVDKDTILDDQLSRLRTFLLSVDGLEIQQEDGQNQAQILPEKKQIRLKEKRVLKFSLKLPDAANLPMTVEQSIEWTLSFVLPRDGKEPHWIIADWEESN